jgi:hypothetical protein
MQERTMAGEHLARVQSLATSASDDQLACRALALGARVTYQLCEVTRAAGIGRDHRR